MRDFGARLRLFIEPSTGVRVMQERMRAAKDAEHLRRMLLYRGLLVAWYGIHISPGATIGERLTLAHPSGQVIGSGVVIGNDVTIYQHATVGARHDGYPVVGHNVVIWPGACVIGPVVVGDGAVIAPNAVVITDVEPGSTYGGVPARPL